MTKRVAFRERDLTRAIRAGVKAGARVARAEIDPDGRMVVVFAHDETPPTADAFGQWEAKKNARRVEGN